MAGAEVMGDLFVSNGSPGWVVVTIHDENQHLRGTVTCNVMLAGGQVETVGVFQVTGEYGAWSAPLPMAGGGALRPADRLQRYGRRQRAARRVIRSSSFVVSMVETDERLPDREVALSVITVPDDSSPAPVERTGRGTGWAPRRADISRLLAAFSVAAVAVALIAIGWSRGFGGASSGHR
jgi:hypothetical protein